jgi:hypothetical protein
MKTSKVLSDRQNVRIYWVLATLAASCLTQPPQYSDLPAGTGGASGSGGSGGSARPGQMSGGSGGASEPSGVGGDASGAGLGPSDGGDPSPVDGPAMPEPEPEPAACGNGRIDPGETCDPPSECQSSCPEITCTRQRLLGTPDKCNVRCEEEKITTCTTGDKCCPRAANSACNAVNDAECAAVCDNATVEAGETCDPKAECQRRADACKEDKDTLRTPTGDVSACTFACTERKRPCQAGDGQCPTTCTAATDPECGGCGNGRMEAGETCDPPAECQRRAEMCRDDRDTIRTASGNAGACTFVCMERKRACQAGDGECPAGCAATADADCAGCGNRRVDPGETCDPCTNTSCTSDRDTIRTPGGSAMSCTFRCETRPRPCSQQSDGQCPSSCSPAQDADCKKDNGQDCSGGGECRTGNCANGVCCNSACNDGCRSCRISGRVGTCSAPSNSEACGNGANGGNGVDDNCNGQVDEGCCGGAGKACCGDRLPDRFGCEAGLTCGENAPRRCVPCGGNGQECCDSTTSVNSCRQSGDGNNLTCFLDDNPNACRPCGRLGLRCCERNADSGDYFCDGSLICSDVDTTCVMP